MKKDFLVELAHLGVTARIRRLGESFLYNIKELYQYANIDIEPSWHLVFLKLEEEKEISMNELSQNLNISKAAITKMIKRMQDKGYVKVISSSSDGRMKMLQLSKKAKERLPEFKLVWDAGRKAIAELLIANESFMESLEKIEIQNEAESFSERAIRIYKNS